MPAVICTGPRGQKRNRAHQWDGIWDQSLQYPKTHEFRPDERRAQARGAKKKNLAIPSCSGGGVGIIQIREERKY